MRLFPRLLAPLTVVILIGCAAALGGHRPVASASTLKTSGSLSALDEHTTIRVRSGESIQNAVDHARPGDSVSIAPGTYRESVTITTPRLTLVGAGPATVIEPAARPRSACGQAGAGICAMGSASRPLSDVHISQLTVRKFKKSGIWGSWTDRMLVTNVHAEHNGQTGIGQQQSTRGRFQNNTATSNGLAGILVANVIDREGGAIDTKGAVIEHNNTDGNHIGILIRRARQLVIHNNRVTHNCGGIFVVGDENVPHAGALTIRGNAVYRNNAYCPANSRLPFVQGTGIFLTGVEYTQVMDNSVVGNTGRSPLSGGIVLFRSRVGIPNHHNTIQGNFALNNGPADLADRDIGTHNAFLQNTCGISLPTGHCPTSHQNEKTTSS